jgi:probable F420-dependent oxidoreductase
VRVSITVSGFGRLFGGDLRAVLEVARAADAAGIDQLALADHVVMGERLDRYPFGTFPYPPGEPWPEPMTVLAAIAAVTERTRLATGILISPLRPAVLLAKTAATLDQLAAGRLDLGVGLGWQREEYEASGVPFGARWTWFADQLRACCALWTREPPVTFESETVRFGPTWCEPRPRQASPASGIPLWFGLAASPRNVALMSELGSGWMPIHTTTRDGLGAGIAALPDGFEVRAGVPVVLHDDGRLDVAATRAAVAPLAELGVTVANVPLGRHLRDTGDVIRFVESLPSAFDSA